MMRVLITGASGTLAFSFKKYFESNDINYVGIDLCSNKNISLCNIVSYNDLYDFAKKHKIDCVFHLAAETNVDWCETNKVLAIANNFISSKNIVQYCKYLQIPLIFISTASVFDGTNPDAYVETDKPNPSNFHAQTKLWAEQYIMNNLKEYIIIRIGWLFGNPKIDKKFIGNIYNQIITGKKILYAVEDLRGTVTYADEVAKLILKLCQNEYWGLFHYASKGSVSRYEILNSIIVKLGLNSSIQVKPVKHTFFKTEAKRPRNESIKSEKLSKLCIDGSKTWSVTLDEYLSDYFDAL